MHVESPQLCDNSSEWFRIFILIAPKRFAFTRCYHKHIPQSPGKIQTLSLTQSLEITGDLWKDCEEGKSASLSSAQALLLKSVNCFPLGGLGGDHINDSKSALVENINFPQQIDMPFSFVSETTEALSKLLHLSFHANTTSFVGSYLILLQRWSLRKSHCLSLRWHEQCDHGGKPFFLWPQQNQQFEPTVPYVQRYNLNHWCTCEISRQQKVRYKNPLLWLKLLGTLSLHMLGCIFLC